jgi:hypothetical protein
MGCHDVILCWFQRRAGATLLFFTNIIVLLVIRQEENGLIWPGVITPLSSPRLDIGRASGKLNKVVGKARL